MRILLVYPDTDPLSIIPNGLINIEPLALEYLAGELPDHDVRILDMKVEKHWQRVIDEFQPRLIALTGTVVHQQRMIEVAEYAKIMCHDVTVAVGGPHATLSRHDFESPSIDAVFTGYWTSSFREFVRDIDAGRSPQPAGNMLLRRNGTWEVGENGMPPKDLDHLPMPRRELTAGWRHHYRHLVWKPVALMISSIGCPQRCNFCPCPVLTGHRVLRRMPELFVAELQQLSEPYIYVADDNFFFDYHHAMRIHDLIRDAGISKQYYFLSRVDDIVRHPDLVEKWAQIGLKKVFIGLESPNDEEIKALNKKGSVGENTRALEILHANHVDPLGAFIVRPEYTRADFDRILEYMDRMGIYYFEFTVLTPFPGTAFYEEVEHEIIHHDTRLFDLAHTLFPTQLPTHQFYREYSRLHRRASSPLRAWRIKPTVSPFHHLAYFRLAPRLVTLLIGSRRAYHDLERMEANEAGITDRTAA